MLNESMKKISCILILFLSSLSLFAQQGNIFSMQQTIKNAPSPAKLVNDYASILTQDQQQSLEYKLVQLDDSTSTQIAVVIVPSLDGYDVADAATELGTSWGVGGKKNNGVVLLICVDKNNRKLNISPGYGLEGGLTDITASHIIDDVIVPNFKGGDYYRGIDDGTNAIIKAVKGEYNTPRKAKGNGRGFSTLMIIIMIIVFLLVSRGGGGKGGRFMSRRGSILGPMILSDLLGGSGRGGGGWSGGGGSSGGGGFGGFGGGSFGGGGASGSW